jgi:uncharacterized protein YjiK
MLQKNSSGLLHFPRVYFTLAGAFIMLLLMGARCEASRAANHSEGLALDSIPYDLSNPTQKIVLEDEALREISGLGFTADPGIISAIADEKGEIFMLDMTKNGQIARRFVFKEKGDFEGIEMVGDTIYAMQSNGKLFQIINWKNNATPTIHIFDNLLTEDHDIEGLCYDPHKQVLLIACKENPELNTVRNIWAFDIKTQKLSDKPAYSIDPGKIDEVVPAQEDDKERHFSTSGIAIHPQTGDLYVISSALKRLAVLDGKTGVLKSACRLDRNVLVQPEGITFDSTGNLYISSEGKKHQGYILKYEKRKTAQN